MAGSWNAAAGEVRHVTIDLADGTPREGRRSIRVNEGEEAVIRWTSDRPLTLHLHGYDVRVVAAPGKPAEMRFDAHATGRFPVELHDDGRHHVVLYVEVYPE